MPTGLGDEKLWLCPTLDNVTPFNDLSDQANNGTAVGGLSTVADTSNGGAFAYDFDGTDDYIDIASSGISGSPTSAYSVSVWVNPSVTTLFHVFLAGQTNGSRFVNLGNNNANGNILCGQSNDWLQAGSYDLNQWQCVCYTYDGTAVSLYKNGVLIGSRTDAPVNFVEQVVRMGADTSGIALLAGKTDDLRTFDRVLTQAEITHLAEARGIEGPPPVGLGDEQTWFCPSLNESADITGKNTFDLDTASIVSDTGSGGSKALSCVNTSSLLTPVSNDPYGLIADVSYTIWINTNATSSKWVTGGGSGKRNPWISSNATFSYFYQGSNYSEIDTPATGSWNHYAFVKTGSSQSVYINGVLDTTDASPALTPKNSGYTARLGGTSCNHKMDDYRGYTRAITQAEITHLASQRGVEGPAPVGLGTEKTWLCPSLLDAPTDITGNKSYTYGGGLATVANTESGGSRAYDFDQSAAKGVFQSASEVMDDTDSFAVSCWMNISTLSTVNYYILDCRSGSGQGFLLLLRSNAGQAYLGTLIVRGSSVINTSSIAFGETSAEFINTPRFCVVNWDNVAETWTLYNDGVFVGSYSPAVTGGSAVSTGTHCAVGNYPVTPGTVYPPIGLIDDLRVHNRVLTQAEITHLATSRGIEGSPSTPTTQYNAFITHAFKQLFQQRLR